MHLLISLFLFLTMTAVATAQADTRRPNILWLIAEDFGPDLGCYGTQQVWTPHLDKLAADGVRYTRAYTTAPVCSASRSAIMTGMYQTTIGAHNHRSHRDDGYRLPDGVRVFPDWFRDAGYFTANVRQLPAEFGFNGSGKTDWNFTYTGKAFKSDEWSDLKTHQPFIAQVNFQETHRKFHAPTKADPALVPIPPYYPDHPVTRKDYAEYLDAASELDRKIGLILKQLETDGLAANTIVVFMADHGQAHVRGKQFVYEEGLHIPLIIRWPSAFAAPKNFRAGSVDERFIEAIDIAPTLLTLAGATKPPKMQGRVFLGEKSETPRQYAFGARDRCDETVFRFRTVRDERYRYIKNFMPDRPFLQQNDYKERSYPVWNLLKELDAQGKLTPAQKFLTAPSMPPEELYDLKADPHEINNLATSTNPEHQTALARLRGVLTQWIEETNDQGRIAEPAAVAAAKGATKPGNDPTSGTPKKAKKKAGGNSQKMQEAAETCDSENAVKAVTVDSEPKPITYPITVTGRAIDSAGKRIAGAKVYVASRLAAYARIAETTTDAEGSFTFRDLPLPMEAYSRGRVGRFQIFGTADGYGFAWEPTKQVEPDAKPPTNDLFEFLLEYLPAAKLSGTVVDEKGMPIRGATLALRHCDRLSARPRYGTGEAFESLNERNTVPQELKVRTTDAEGRFEFSDLRGIADFAFL